MTILTPALPVPHLFGVVNLFLILLPNNTWLSTVFGEEGKGEVVTNHLSGGWQ